MISQATSPEMRVETGQVWRLGKHRLMCGDATNKEDVAKLFAGERPTLVVTSPPYAKQRDYDRPIACWDSMMMGALDGHDVTSDVQLLINLGLPRVKNEVFLYYVNWLQQMRRKGWKHVGQYVWDKKEPAFGNNGGSCRTEHEFVFHLRKQAVLLNDTVVNKFAGTQQRKYKYRHADGAPDPLSKLGIVRAKRPNGSIFRCSPEKQNRTGHPAVFPVSLPKQLIAAWRKPGCITYDPFCGAGTTLLAAEQENVTGLGMEISPAYCAMAIARWNKQPGVTPAYLVGSESLALKLTFPLQLTLSIQPEATHDKPAYLAQQ